MARVKDNSEYRDYSITFTRPDGTKEKWYGSEETLLREEPLITIIKKTKLRGDWRTKKKV